MAKPSLFDIYHHDSVSTVHPDRGREDHEAFFWMGSQAGSNVRDALIEWRDTNDGDPGRYWVIHHASYGLELHEFDVTADTVWQVERVLPAPDLKPVA